MKGLKEQLKRLDFSLNNGLIGLADFTLRKNAINQAVNLFRIANLNNLTI